MRKIVLVIVLVIAQLTIKAQVAFDSILIGGTNWGSLYNVKEILHDDMGNIWLAYSNPPLPNLSGLKKFDGSNWTQFQTTNSGLPDNRVNTIKQDDIGRYWVGTSNGLAIYDGSWTVYNQANSGICSNNIRAIEFESDTVWIATSQGVSKFDGTSWVTYNFSTSGLYPEDCYSLLKLQNKLFIGNSLGLSIIENGNVVNHNRFFIGGDQTARIIYDQNIGIVLSNKKGVYKFVNDNYVELEEALGLCLNSISTTIFSEAQKNICEMPNNNVLLKTALQLKQINPVSYRVDNVGNSFSYINVFQNNVFFLASYNSLSYVLKIDIDSINTEYESNEGLMYNCPQEKLDVNQVSARVLPLGDMFWDLNSNPGYEVPKSSGLFISSAGSIWVGGKVNDQLRTACQTFRQIGVDFWPGPLDTTDATNPVISPLGKVVKVNRFDIENFIYNYNNGSVQSGSFIPSAGILYWPAHDTGNFSRNTAPFIDVNNDGIYNPLTGGDYPEIKGDQELYSIYNDASGQHLESGSSGQMGIEIHQSSYAYTCDEIADSMSILNYTTFYEFEIINRSDTLIDSMYVAFWNDVDLGNYLDDYIGCNVTENYGYVYNGDNYDDDTPNDRIGYHQYLPCFSTAIMESPKAIINDGKDNNHNGLVDEQNEDLGMSSFLGYNNSLDSITGNPTSNPSHYYNYMQGKWKNGSLMKYGGSGTNGAIPTIYQFSSNSDPIGYGVGGTISNPNPQPAWTETTGGNVPGDRRFLISSGPFQLAAKDTTKIVYAMVFTIDSAVTGDMTHNIIKSESDVRRIKAWYRNNNFPSCLDVSTVSVKEIKTNELSVKAYPNPTSGLITIQTEEFNSSTKIVVTDLLGKTLLSKQMYSQTEVINMSQYESGIYFIKVCDNLKQKTIKIIKS